MKQTDRYGRSIRCVEGTLYRHDPSFYDPYYESNIGTCPECRGKGCTDALDDLDALADEPTADPASAIDDVRSDLAKIMEVVS